MALKFKNELGKDIYMSCECDQDSKEADTRIFISGPYSEHELFLTLYEAQRLRELLVDDVP